MTGFRPSELTLVMTEDFVRVAGLFERDLRGFTVFAREHGLPCLDLPMLGVPAFEFLTQTEAAALILFARLRDDGVGEFEAACTAVVLARRESQVGAAPAVAAAFEVVAKIFGSADVVRLKVSVQVEGA